MKHSLGADNNVKMGEETPVVIQDIPNTADAIIANRVNTIIPKRDYFGRLTKKATFRRQRGKKLAINGVKQERGRYFIKGCATLPHDQAQFHPGSNTFQPSIFLDIPAAHQQFTLVFMEDCRELSFMVSCKCQTIYWNVHLKDFATELHAALSIYVILYFIKISDGSIVIGLPFCDILVHCSNCFFIFTHTLCSFHY